MNDRDQTIDKLMSTQTGRDQLAASMEDPIRERVGQKTLLNLLHQNPELDTQVIQAHIAKAYPRHLPWGPHTSAQAATRTMDLLVTALHQELDKRLYTALQGHTDPRNEAMPPETYDTVLLHARTYAQMRKDGTLDPSYDTHTYRDAAIRTCNLVPLGQLVGMNPTVGRYNYLMRLTDVSQTIRDLKRSVKVYGVSLHYYLRIELAPNPAVTYTYQ